MLVCTRRIEWDAMHRIPNHEGRCRAFHGHRYVAEVTCHAPSLDALGRIVDFGVIKERVGGWVDAQWDHTAILMRGDSDPAALAIAACVPEAELAPDHIIPSVFNTVVAPRVAAACAEAARADGVCR